MTTNFINSFLKSLEIEIQERDLGLARFNNQTKKIKGKVIDGNIKNFNKEVLNMSDSTPMKRQATATKKYINTNWVFIILNMFIVQHRKSIWDQIRYQINHLTLI